MRWMGTWVLLGVAACGGGAADLVAPGDEPLSIRRPEPAGANCAHGGEAVLTGADLDRDGVLDPDEVTYTEYACDPSTTVVTREDALAPSLACPAGGIVVHTGVDDNDDGVLQDAEIDHTTQTCGSLEIWRGDFRFFDAEDPVKLAALAGARVVTGSLDASRVDIDLPLLDQVAGNVMTSDHVVMPGLTHIGGSLTLARTSAFDLSSLQTLGGRLQLRGELTALRIPHLATIGNSIELNSAKRLDLELPEVTEIRGDLFARPLSTLHSLALPRLQRLDGSLVMEFASNLTSLVIATESTGEAEITGNVRLVRLDALTTLDLGHVAVVGRDLTIMTMENLPSIGLDSLRAIHGTNARIGDLQMLSGFELPALAEVSGTLLIDDLWVKDLALPALTSVDTLRVFGNVLLERFAAPALTSVNALAIDLNEAITTLDLGQLTSANSVTIGDVRLSELSGLRRLETVGELRLALSDCQELSGLVALRTVGSLSISHAFELRSLDGLEHITSLTGGLVLNFNAQLTSLAGLANLSHIGGTLRITDNAELAELALPSLQSIGGALELLRLPRLASLAGLSAVETVGGALTFTSVPLLTADEIARFTAQVGR